MHKTKSARFESTPDRPHPQASGNELPTGEHAVLAFRESRERSLALRECLTPRPFLTCR
jgi:hypothetical protein